MATKIRDIAGKSIYELKPLLLILITTSKIFLEDIEIEFEEITISVNDVKEEVEHRINLLNIDWLAKVHNSIITDPTLEDPTNDFAILLYMLSRNKREELRWTISQIVKDGKNSELALISSDYTKLLSILLQLNENVRDAGLKDIHNAINIANDTDPLDLIDFNSILQTSEDIIILKFVEAIKIQLASLKALALQLIQMEDIRTTFQMIVQFTDLESNLDLDNSIEQYIESLGKTII